MIFECLTKNEILLADNGCCPNDECRPYDECYPADCDCHPGDDSWCRPELGDECAP